MISAWLMVFLFCSACLQSASIFLTSSSLLISGFSFTFFLVVFSSDAFFLAILPSCPTFRGDDDTHHNRVTLYLSNAYIQHTPLICVSIYAPSHKLRTSHARVNMKKQAWIQTLTLP